MCLAYSIDSISTIQDEREAEANFGKMKKKRKENVFERWTWI